ncbi:universal stress protein [Marixanthomonas spongiae]|uniref:Universal stress protein n=1 Tax=Marixanthomonas spongiae TaxID=2174845 RepID=A0A2U0I443_9FLAO|nr:universal stress protein [Marixanthomonas spongiae]PVW15883.1 universal stress protein [Marixanthomonas spongiae]
MKKILVPTDFSKYAEYALKTAASIAKRHDAELIVVHMLGLTEAVINKDESREVMEALYYMKLAEKRFEEFLDQPYLEGVTVQTNVQNYRVFTEIGNFAKEYDCDLIVMGSNGSSGWNEVFVGSNTEKVVRTSEIPVLVIKDDQDEFKINKAVFASDFKEENLFAYRKAMQFFQLFDAEVKLLYVHLPAEQFKSTYEIEDRIVGFLSKSKLDDAHSIHNVVFQNAYTVESGIFNYSNRIGADVIAIPTHGRRGLAHFFSGSIGEDVVNHSKIPVVTFKI